MYIVLTLWSYRLFLSFVCVYLYKYVLFFTFKRQALNQWTYTLIHVYTLGIAAKQLIYR